MNKKLKITCIVFGVIIMFAIFLMSLTIGLNWKYIAGNISGKPYYSQEEVDETLKEHDNLISDLKLQLATSQDEVSLLTIQVQGYESQNTELKSQVDSLTTSCDNALAQKQLLETENAENSKQILALQTENVANKGEIARLKANGEADSAEIARLETKITQNEVLISNLQMTNESNQEMIIKINNNIVTLSNQIVEMTNQLQANYQTVSALNSRISQLEKSVVYYETFIANLENGEQVVATFEFNGSVYNLQIVQKGSSAVPTTPISTEYVIFNYWMLNNEQVDPSAIALTTNTKFVANVTYKYDVKFTSDSQEISVQIVEKNGVPTLPTAPTKEGYSFEGWTKDGVNVVDPLTTPVTANTIYIAKFSQLLTVNFVSETETVSSQQVKSGEFAKEVTIESTQYRIFNGWKVNNEFVTISTYPITVNTTFVADYTYKYDVVFTVDDQLYGDEQIIEENSYSTLPTVPTKEGYIFKGWTIDGINIVDPLATPITANTTFIAKFMDIYAILNSEMAKTLILNKFSTTFSESMADPAIDPSTSEIETMYLIESEARLYVKLVGREKFIYVLNFLVDETNKIEDIDESNINDFISNSSAVKFNFMSYFVEEGYENCFVNYKQLSVLSYEIYRHTFNEATNTCLYERFFVEKSGSGALSSTVAIKTTVTGVSDNCTAVLEETSEVSFKLITNLIYFD